MVFCGNCKQGDQTIEHVRECFKQRYAVLEATPVEPSGFAKAYANKRSDYSPMALKQEIPESYYALDTPAGVHFYRVRNGKAGSRWDGMQFVDRLIGHPGDWLPEPVKGANRKAVLSLIAQDPKGAAVLYGKRFTVCGVCQSPLSDPLSIEAGIGPICAKRFS